MERTLIAFCLPSHNATNDTRSRKFCNKPKMQHFIGTKIHTNQKNTTVVNDKYAILTLIFVPRNLILNRGLDPNLP